jgi:hypothetical protein
VDIAFNVVRLESFKKMIEAIRRYDPHLKPPNNQELRVSLLKRQLDYTNDLLKGYRDE